MFTMQFTISTAKDAVVAAAVLKAASAHLPADDAFSVTLQPPAAAAESLPPNTSASELPNRPRRGRPPKDGTAVTYVDVAPQEGGQTAPESSVTDDELTNLMDDGGSDNDLNNLFGDEPAATPANPYASWDRTKMLDALRNRAKALGADWFRTMLSAAKVAKMTELSDDQMRSALAGSDHLAKKTA